MQRTKQRRLALRTEGFQGSADVEDKIQQILATDLTTHIRADHIAQPGTLPRVAPVLVQAKMVLSQRRIT